MKAELLPGIYVVAAGRFGFGHPIDCNVYLVKGSMRSVLIDAGSGFGVRQTVEALKSYGCEPGDIDTVLLTHSHWDHARGATPLVELGVNRAAIHGSGITAVTTGPKWFEFQFEAAPEVTFEGLGEVDTLADGDVIDLGDRTLRVMHTPGHTDDSVCFFFEVDGRRYAFTGDTVCAFGTPGVMTAETRFQSYRDSLQMLDELKLDGIYPGHGVWVEQLASDHVAALSTRLSGKWSDLAPHPKPLDSGIWVLRNHPELVNGASAASALSTN